MTGPIKITIKGGTILAIENIPPALRLEVHNYDIKGIGLINLKLDKWNEHFQLRVFQG